MSKMNIAYTAVLSDHAVDGMYWSLGLAEENVPGYSPIKEANDPADPHYMPKGPTRFATQADANAEADRKNEQELGLTVLDAQRIVFSSIGAQIRSRAKTRRG